MRPDLALVTLHAHDDLVVGGLLLQLENSGLNFRLWVTVGLLLQLQNSDHVQVQGLVQGLV